MIFRCIEKLPIFHSQYYTSSVVIGLNGNERSEKAKHVHAYLDITW